MLMDQSRSLHQTIVPKILRRFLAMTRKSGEICDLSLIPNRST